MWTKVNQSFCSLHGNNKPLYWVQSIQTLQKSLACNSALPAFLRWNVIEMTEMAMIYDYHSNSINYPRLSYKHEKGKYGNNSSTTAEVEWEDQPKWNGRPRPRPKPFHLLIVLGNDPWLVKHPVAEGKVYMKCVPRLISVKKLIEIKANKARLLKDCFLPLNVCCVVIWFAFHSRCVDLFPLKWWILPRVLNFDCSQISGCCMAKYSIHLFRP